VTGLLFLPLILATLPVPYHHKKMKFPSIKNLAQSAVTVLKRFPFEMLFALIGAVAGITLTELTGISQSAEIWCVRLIMTANMGLLVSLATTLYCESKGIKRGTSFIFKVIAALFGASLIFLINPFKNESDYIRFFLLSLSLHLLVAFAAFIKHGHIQGFWQFNKNLFLRFLTSVLYSAVLFGGIAAAIGAMNFLFNFKFEWDAFAILWILIVALFNTLFFLAGVPNNIASLDEDTSYPKGLKIFTQYVLIPLATIYVVILLAYEIKILIEWNLPKGLVSNLILGYAVFGILSVLLVFPIREQAENKWIKTYSRSFYFLMLPLIALFFVAVGTRILKYGITEYRYFLILLACWLLFITTYFLVSRKQNIKLIPISLCVLTLLSIYGPQSAFSVSMYSQRRILVNIFKRNHYFKDDKLMPVDSNKIQQKEANAAVRMLSYMINHYDLSSLQPYINKDLSAVSDSLMKVKSYHYRGNYLSSGSVDKWELRERKEEWLKKYLNLGKFSGSGYDYQENLHPESNYHFSTSEESFTRTKGYDYVLNTGNRTNDTSNYGIDKLHLRLINRNDSTLYIKLNNETVDFHLKELMGDIVKNKEAIKKYKGAGDISETAFGLPQNMLTFSKQTKEYIITLKISDIQFKINKKKDVTDIATFDARYLIKVK
jgi:hypothetical protein